MWNKVENDSIMCKVEKSCEQHFMPSGNQALDDRSKAIAIYQNKQNTDNK